MPFLEWKKVRRWLRRDYESVAGRARYGTERGGDETRACCNAIMHDHVRQTPPWPQKLLKHIQRYLLLYQSHPLLCLCACCPPHTLSAFHTQRLQPQRRPLMGVWVTSINRGQKAEEELQRRPAKEMPGDQVVWGCCWCGVEYV